MSFSEFKKYFNLEKDFDNQKIQNDLKLKVFIKKAKRSFFGLGILSSILFFTLASSSYDNYLKIKYYFYFKYKIFKFRFKLFSRREKKINYLMLSIQKNVINFYKTL